MTTIDDLTLSQLADGELPRDQMVKALQSVLENAELRERLQQHLQLRDATAAWRTQPVEMAIPEMAAASAPAHRPAPRQWGGMLAACALGGLLVFAGLWAGQTLQKGNHVAVETRPGPDQRQVIAQVFKFHESVAGPLKAFVADDKAVELAPADEEHPAGRPLAMILRLTTGEGQTAATHDYVVVCRQDEPVTIPLPQSGGQSPSGKLYLSPAVQKDEVGLRYSLTVDDQKASSGSAIIAGRRTVGNDFRPLGEVALGTQNLRAEASAWPLE